VTHQVRMRAPDASRGDHHVFAEMPDEFVT